MREARSCKRRKARQVESRTRIDLSALTAGRCALTPYESSPARILKKTVRELAIDVSSMQLTSITWPASAQRWLLETQQRMKGLMRSDLPGLFAACVDPRRCNEAQPAAVLTDPL